jgi:hypothetical protein
MRPVTPSKLSPTLVALCEELVPGGAPVVLPADTTKSPTSMDSFEAVERRVVGAGGTACYGWELWQWEGLFIQADFHSVWRQPNGMLQDITPRPASVQTILFLPDPARIFDGRRVNSVRRPISKDPTVSSFLRVCDEEFALLNRGARAFMRNIALQGAELGELQQIWQRKTALIERLQTLQNS